MTEEKLTATDRKSIKLDLKVSYIIGLIFLIAVVLFIVLILFGGTLIGFKPKDGFITRATFVFSIFLISMIFGWMSYFKHYVDLTKGIKVNLTLNHYTLLTEKDKTFLISDEPQFGRIEIYQGIVQFIDMNRPLRIELAKYSKSILFISHDADNYMDKPI